MYDEYGFVLVTNAYWIICAILVGIKLILLQLPISFM